MLISESLKLFKHNCSNQIKSEHTQIKAKQNNLFQLLKLWNWTASKYTTNIKIKPKYDSIVDLKVHTDQASTHGRNTSVQLNPSLTNGFLCVVLLEMEQMFLKFHS